MSYINTLDTLNIRKGLELGVDVADIFKIKTEPQGEVRAKEIHEIGWDTYLLDNPGAYEELLKSGGLIYTSKKEEFKISDSLIAYVFTSYIVDTNEEDEDKEVIVDASKEIEFLNTEILNFEEFCENIMAAQRFTGKYKTSMFKFSFYGYGSFSIEEYLSVHTMIVMSNVHSLNFFITTKNVLSGIGSFITGLYRNDIIRQREYLSSIEFATLLDEADKQFEMFSSIIEESSE